MKEMDENMKSFHSTGNPSSADQPASKTSSPKGDYIDFEEIK